MRIEPIQRVRPVAPVRRDDPRTVDKKPAAPADANTVGELLDAPGDEVGRGGLPIYRRPPL